MKKNKLLTILSSLSITTLIIPTIASCSTVQTVTITLDAGEHGKISQSTISINANKTWGEIKSSIPSPTADSGWKFKEWTYNGSSIKDDLKISSNITIKAVYEQDQPEVSYTVNFKASSGVTLSGTTSVKVASGTKWSAITKPAITVASTHTAYGWCKPASYDLIEDDFAITSDFEPTYVAVDTEATFARVTVKVLGDSKEYKTIKGYTWGQTKAYYGIKDPEVESKIFNCWKDHLGDVVTDSYVINNNCTITAYFYDSVDITWTAKGCIVFDEVPTKKVPVGTLWQTVALPKFHSSETPYTFFGYYDVTNQRWMKEGLTIDNACEIAVIGVPDSQLTTIHLFDADQPRDLIVVKGWTWQDVKDVYHINNPKNQKYLAHYSDPEQNWYNKDTNQPVKLTDTITDITNIEGRYYQKYFPINNETTNSYMIMKDSISSSEFHSHEVAENTNYTAEIFIKPQYKLNTTSTHIKIGNTIYHDKESGVTIDTQNIFIPKALVINENTTSAVNIEIHYDLAIDDSIVLSTDLYSLSSFCSDYESGAITKDQFLSRLRFNDQTVVSSENQLIGALIKVPLNGIDHYMRIIGFEHDTIASGTTKGKKAALTLETASLICGDDGKVLLTPSSFNEYTSTTGELKDALQSTNPVSWYIRNPEYGPGVPTYIKSSKYTTSCLSMFQKQAKISPLPVEKSSKYSVYNQETQSIETKETPFNAYLFPLTTTEMCCEVETEYIKDISNGSPYTWYQTHTTNYDRIKPCTNGRQNFGGSGFSYQTLTSWAIKHPSGPSSVGGRQVIEDSGKVDKHSPTTDQYYIPVSFAFCL